MKEYEVIKTIELTFFIEANSKLEAEEKVWTLDDNASIGYDVYDIEVYDISGEEE